MRGPAKIYQKKIVARRRKKTFFLSLFALFIFGLAFSGLSFASQAERLSIRRIVVSGNERLSAGAIAALVEEELSGNYLHFFSRKNAFIYPKSGIGETLAALPLVKEARVSKEGIDSIAVSVVERKESVLWCDERCYSMDEEGLVFAPAASSSPSFAYRGLIEDDPVGERFLPPERFRNIQFFIRELSGLGVSPREAEIAETGYMTVRLAAGGRLILRTQDDLSVILDNIATLIGDKTLAPDPEAFLARLDYIKLDTGDKVVYKLKN